MLGALKKGVQLILPLDRRPYKASYTEGWGRNKRHAYLLGREEKPLLPPTLPPDRAASASSGVAVNNSAAPRSAAAVFITFAFTSASFSSVEFGPLGLRSAEQETAGAKVRCRFKCDAWRRSNACTRVERTFSFVRVSPRFTEILVDAIGLGVSSTYSGLLRYIVKGYPYRQNGEQSNNNLNGRFRTGISYMVCRETRIDICGRCIPWPCDGTTFVWYYSKRVQHGKRYAKWIIFVFCMPLYSLETSQEMK